MKSCSGHQREDQKGLLFFMPVTVLLSYWLTAYAVAFGSNPVPGTKKMKTKKVFFFYARNSPLSSRPDSITSSYRESAKTQITISDMIFQKKFGNTTFFHYLCKSKPPVISLLKRLVFNLYRKSRFGQIGVGTM